MKKVMSISTDGEKHYWMLVNKNGNPLVINGQLPIYWLRKVAREVGKIHGAYDVVKVSIK